MRYFKIDAKSDSSFQETYYIEADNFVSQEEIRDYVAQVAAVDFIYSNSESEEEFTVKDPIEIKNDDMLMIVSDIYVRSKLLITALNNTNNIILGIYHREKEYSPQKSEYFIFSAAGGQEADVTSIGKTDSNTSLETVIYQGWIDCISQLKRYWQVSGVAIASGLFTIQNIPKMEYELERSEREIVVG